MPKANILSPLIMLFFEKLDDIPQISKNVPAKTGTKESTNLESIIKLTR